MSRKEIINLVEKESDRHLDCVAKDVTELKDDVNEIKIALLGGNKFKSGQGLIDMVKHSYEHSKKAEDLEVLPRLKKVAVHYEEWDKDGTWIKIEELLDSFNFSKRLITFLGIGSAAGIIALILGIITAFDLISNLFN